MSNPKREKTPFDVAGFIQRGKQDLEPAVATLLETKALPAPARPAEDIAGVSRQQPVPASRAEIRIVALRTLGQQGEQSVFEMHADALKLAVDLTASHESVSSEMRFDCSFQLVDYSTGRVRVEMWSRNLKVQWGHDFWISLGNNSGQDPRQFTTPAKWGLDPGLYIFRALVESGRSVVYASATEVGIRVFDSQAKREHWHRS
jgi:hypothetical protein